jgi:hypothetical protein
MAVGGQRRGGDEEDRRSFDERPHPIAEVRVGLALVRNVRRAPGTVT